MIQIIELTNFKCFTKAEVKLDRLNVFAGANGTGKSTFIQALLVLLQSAQTGHLRRNELQLNGSLVDLGTGRDVRFKRSNLDRFEIELWDETGRFTVIAEVPPSAIQHTLAMRIDPANAPMQCLEDRVLYLSADRLGPQKSYPMNLYDTPGNDIGRRGEYAPLLFSRSRALEASNTNLLLENSDKKIFEDIETQFTLWMRRLFPGFQLRTDDHERSDSVLLGINLQKQIGEPEFFRPANVGFGVSVAFPIILAGLLARPKTLLIVENPEAHLHPLAQSLIGEFLARVAAGGAQVFVETHSDHVVNGMRIALKNEVLTTEELHFFAFAKSEEYGSHRVIPVKINASGDFAVRPETFFDQTDKDLKVIYGLE